VLRTGMVIVPLTHIRWTVVEYFESRRFLREEVKSEEILYDLSAVPDFLTKTKGEAEQCVI
jgi:hypothetical protein